MSVDDSAETRVDKVSPIKRSEVMAAVRSSGTKAELIVADALKMLGARYRVNVRDLPGKPDFANKRAKRAIFVHGCFWHRHKGCSKARMPKSNQSYWQPKFRGNVARDVHNARNLKGMGYRTIVIWECQLRKRSALLNRLRRFVAS